LRTRERRGLNGLARRKSVIVRRSGKQTLRIMSKKGREENMGVWPEMIKGGRVRLKKKTRTLGGRKLKTVGRLATRGEVITISHQKGKAMPPERGTGKRTILNRPNRRRGRKALSKSQNRKEKWVDPSSAKNRKEPQGKTMGAWANIDKETFPREGFS